MTIRCTSTPSRSPTRKSQNKIACRCFPVGGHTRRQVGKRRALLRAQNCLLKKRESKTVSAVAHARGVERQGKHSRRRDRAGRAARQERNSQTACFFPFQAVTFQNKKSPRPFFGARFFVSKEYTHKNAFAKKLTQLQLKNATGQSVPLPRKKGSANGFEQNPKRRFLLLVQVDDVPDDFRVDA